MEGNPYDHGCIQLKRNKKKQSFKFNTDEIKMDFPTAPRLIKVKSLDKLDRISVNIKELEKFHF